MEVGLNRKVSRNKHELGSDIARQVEAAGRNVKQHQPGDEAFGDLSERVGAALSQSTILRFSAKKALFLI